MQIGSTRLTADGYVVGASGTPTRVFAVIVKSTGTAAVVALENAATTEYDSIDGTISKAVIRQYPGGLLFPDGCNVNVDANTSYVTVIYVKEPA